MGVSSKASQRAVTVAAFGLLAAALALLVLGRFIQFDDTSGFGIDEWMMPFGVPSGFAAAASVVLACSETRARRMLGGTLLLLAVLVSLLVLTIEVSVSSGLAGRVSSGTS